MSAETNKPKAPRQYSEPQTRTLGFSVQAGQPVLDELVDYFGDGHRSAYLRATYRVTKTIMLAEQLRDLQAYGRQRTVEPGFEAAEVPDRIREFLKGGA